jgi:tellurite resistance protein
MTSQDRESILAICLMAAFADGNNDERERIEIKRITESLSEGAGVNMALLYQQVLQKQVTLSSAAGQLSTHESRQLAFEMAVCVCDADGAHSPPEKAFLDQLREQLKLDAAASATFVNEAAAVASAPVAVAAASNNIEPHFASTMTDAEMDKMILNYSILNGALELLPQSLASMAIIPLQMNTVSNWIAARSRIFWQHLASVSHHNMWNKLAAD